MYSQKYARKRAWSYAKVRNQYVYRKWGQTKTEEEGSAYEINKH